jgi:3-oxoacyl-[acyl-carrier-protein] synthase-3
MNTFHMDGPAIFKFAAQQVGPFLDSFFERIEWERTDIDVLVPHQASRHAIMQLTGRFGFRREQVFLNLAERGNCVAASIPLALAEAVEGGVIQRGSRVLLVGTGAGLSIGACALTY